jgi:hypothetical protein
MPRSVLISSLAPPTGTPPWCPSSASLLCADPLPWLSSFLRPSEPRPASLEKGQASQGMGISSNKDMQEQYNPSKEKPC